MIPKIIERTILMIWTGQLGMWQVRCARSWSDTTYENMKCVWVSPHHSETPIRYVRVRVSERKYYDTK